MFLDPKKDGEQTAKTLEPWRQLLLDAADLIEQKGLAKLELQQKKTGAVCLQGSMMIIGYGRTISLEEMNKQFPFYIKKLSKHLGTGGWTIEGKRNRLAKWNNAPERTGPEVIAAMRACANS